MNVPLLPFIVEALFLILKPFDKKSTSLLEIAFSASLRFGYKSFTAKLCGSLLLSIMYQLSLFDEDFISTKAGLKPRWTNVPLLDQLPVYDPNLLYPATSLKA